MIPTLTALQAQRVKATVLASVGGVDASGLPAAIPFAGLALDALAAFLSIVGGLMGAPIDAASWRQKGSFTFLVFILFGTVLTPWELVQAACHEGTHVAQTKRLGWSGADGITLPMPVAYLASREAEARLEAEAYATELELGVRCCGWTAAELRACIEDIRDRRMPSYGLSPALRADVAAILDSHAAGLLAGAVGLSPTAAVAVAELAAMGLLADPSAPRDR